MGPDSGHTNRPVSTVRWLLPLVAFVATRIYLVGFFEAALTSDMNFYFDHAVNTVDIGYAPYTEQIRVEYPPVAYWLIAAPRWLDSRRITLAMAERGELPAFFRDYTAAIHFEMLACDVAAFLLFLGIV